MEILRNGCSYNSLTVHPGDWNQPGAFLETEWYIQYRFTDPAHLDRYPQGKLCIVKKGINNLSTLAERRAKVKTLLQEIKTKLDNGFNSITKGKTDKDHRINKGESQPSSPNTSGIIEIQPGMPFIQALWAAYHKFDAVKPHLANVRTVLRSMEKAAAKLKYTNLPIFSIGRKHIKLCLDQCALLNSNWSNDRHNKFRSMLRSLFKILLVEDAVPANPMNDIPVKKNLSKVREVLSPEERVEIDKHLRDRNYNFWRFTVIFYHSGGRRTELMRLQCKHVNIDKQEYKALVLKGRQYKEVIRPIPQAVLPLWKELLAQSQPEQFVFSELFLPGDRQCGYDRITRYWKRYVKNELGIACDFYSLKHLYSDQVAEALDIQHAQLQNSHTNERTTSIYTVGEKRRKMERLKGVDVSFAPVNVKYN